MAMGKFAAVVNCMDGRTQLPVITYLKDKFGVEFIDSITEPGPVKILASQTAGENIDSIKKCLDISVLMHGSEDIAIVAHHDCAGNPTEKETQLKQLTESVEVVKQWYPECRVVGLWVGEKWDVIEV